MFDPGLDLFPLLAGLLASLTCGLLGNFLVLRRISLMGDAISHSVLPGLVAGFLLLGSRSTTAMFAGAAGAGVLAAVLIELVRKSGRMDPGAAMGVVFSVMFALGVVLIERFARQVDLDADCVLHGQLETLAWYGAPDTLRGLLSVETLAATPHEIRVQAIVFLLAVVFVAVLFKELRICAFDPGLATAQGFSAGILHYALMVIVALATVASFEAVGAIIVIAMLVCPAATARLLTDRLPSQLGVSLAAAFSSTMLGYAGARGVPAAIGLPVEDLSVAGMMATASGAVFLCAWLLAPRHGLLAGVLRRRRLSRGVELEDLLGILYRAREAGRDSLTPQALLAMQTPGGGARPLRNATAKGLVRHTPDGIRLSEAGEARAASIIRRHRLWEHYLVEEVGLATDHVHELAERLEHLPPVPDTPVDRDPHGREIPDARDS